MMTVIRIGLNGVIRQGNAVFQTLIIPMSFPILLRMILFFTPGGMEKVPVTGPAAGIMEQNRGIIIGVLPKILKTVISMVSGMRVKDLQMRMVTISGMGPF